MKFFSILSICLLLMSCGPSVLENTDVENHLLAKSSVLNQVKLGDSWEDTKLLAGDYWEVSDDETNKIYQFRKDIDLADEMMFINFILSDGKIGGVGVHIMSKNISTVSMQIYASDLVELYKRQFGIDFASEEFADITFEGHNYSYSIMKDLDSDYPSITILCMDLSFMM